MAVAIDGTPADSGSNLYNTPLAITVGTGNSNTLLLIICGEKGTTISSLTDSAQSGWQKFNSAAGTGSGATLYTGEVWYLLNPNTGAHSVTVNFAAEPTGNAADGTIYSLYNVDQTTPLASFQHGTNATLTMTLSSGDLAVAGQADDNNNYAITSGTQDNSEYHQTGWTSGYGTSSPSQTISWAGSSANDVSVGATVKQVSGGTTPLTFTGTDNLNA